MVVAQYIIAEHQLSGKGPAEWNGVKLLLICDYSFTVCRTVFALIEWECQDCCTVLRPKLHSCFRKYVNQNQNVFSFQTFLHH